MHKGGFLFAFLDIVTAFVIFGAASSSSSIEARLATHLSEQMSKKADNGGELEGFRENTDAFGRPALEVQDDSRRIRVEKGPDPCLENLTKADVVCRMQETRLAQSVYGCADLYPREWESKEISRGRKGVFSVLQFNALAEGLSADPERMTPFTVDQVKKNAVGYGGFSSVPNPKVVLDFSSRRERLLEVILGSDGSAPFSLVGMQEIDHFYGFFRPILHIFGYEGIFTAKRMSSSVELGWYSDGCCLFWKRDAFDLVTERRCNYKVGSQSCIVATLREKATAKAMVVAVTHLKSQPGKSTEEIRCRQVEELLALVDEVAATTAKLDNVQKVPILILGDFNAVPPSQLEPHDDSSVGKMLMHQHAPGQNLYQSAYNVVEPSDSLFTTWKIRDSKEIKRIIDYIFYSGESLRCQATLGMPTGLELTKLPGLRFPSDHIHIGARFEIL